MAKVNLIKTLCCIVFLLPLFAKAWGPTGHRTVGEIAYNHLSSKARTEIKKILGNESLAMASTWADFIRSDTNYKYLSAWHYIDLDQQMTSENIQIRLQTDTGMNVYTRINFLVEQLKGTGLDKDHKQMYLRLLVHLVGDLHQPLHASPKGDNGANSIKVNWFADPSNLHKVWDEDMIDYQKLSYTEYTNAIDFATKQEIKQWQSDPISTWLFESYTESVKIRAELKGETKLGYKYNFNNIQTVNQQLLKAGIRLAGLLNQVFAN